MQVWDTKGKDLIKEQKFFEVNMAGCDMILSLLWLYVLKTYVK